MYTLQTDLPLTSEIKIHEVDYEPIQVDLKYTRLFKQIDGSGGLAVAYGQDILIIAFYSENEKDSEGNHQNSKTVGDHLENHISMLNEDVQTYFEKQKDRDDESGPMRIAKPIKLSPDMYTMLYVSTIHSEYIYVLQKKRIEKKKREELLEKTVVDDT